MINKTRPTSSKFMNPKQGPTVISAPKMFQIISSFLIDLFDLLNLFVRILLGAHIQHHLYYQLATKNAPPSELLLVQVVVVAAKVEVASVGH